MSIFDFMSRKIRRSVVHMYGGGLAGDFRQEAYENAVVRETVDAIARHAAKLHAVHQVQGARRHDKLDYLIGNRPNPYMSAYDFQYKMVSMALTQNNAFALPVWDRQGELSAIIPVQYTSCEALESPETGGVYLRFSLPTGKQTILPYDEMIHLRRHYGKSLILGDDNGPVSKAVELLNTAEAGMMSAVKSGSTLRGIIKLKQAMLKDKDVKQRRDDFVREYMAAGDGSGIAGLDASMDYEQLDPSKMYSLTGEQMREIRANVYRYYGVNEKFVSGSCTEDEWNAIYEAIMEPFAIQMHLEYTHALFTAQQREKGESVQVASNRLQYASVATKTELVKALGMIGMITYDEGREVFNLPPISGGDKLIPSWNTGSSGAADPM